jgi:uncharacterized membrane protein
VEVKNDYFWLAVSGVVIALILVIMYFGSLIFYIINHPLVRL